MGAFLGNPFTLFGAALDPTTITGYELHLIAESLDGTYADGDTATNWPDETGTYTLVASNTPTLEKNELNGKSIVRYVGASSERHRDITPLINWATTYSVVMVVKDNSSGSKILTRCSGGGGAFTIITRDSGDQFEINTKNGSETYKAIDTSPSPARGNWWVIIFTADFTTGSLNVYLNSDTVTASASGSAGIAPPDSYINIGSDALYPDIDVPEFIVYNGHILTAKEIAGINKYFSKYGL